MKTLKQLLLIEKCFDEGQRNEILATVRDWLEQKRQEYQNNATNWSKFDPDIMSHSTTKVFAKVTTIDELLEELKE